MPQGAEISRFRRMIQPFENWTLICDENLKTMKKVCNITQSIVDSEGQFAFSWSLAATEGGKPMMILRTRPNWARTSLSTLKFPGRKDASSARPTPAMRVFALTFLPVGPVLREQIAKAAKAQISYEADPEAALAFGAPLDGLAEALAAIK